MTHKRKVWEEPKTRMGKWAKSIKEKDKIKPNGFFGHYAKHLAETQGRGFRDNEDGQQEETK